MAEVIKYGILGDTALFEELEACPDPSTPAGLGSERLSSILQRSAAAKARVVAADEKEEACGRSSTTAIPSAMWWRPSAAMAPGCMARRLPLAWWPWVNSPCWGSWGREDAERQRRLIDSAGLPTAWPDLAADAVLCRGTKRCATVACAS